MNLPTILIGLAVAGLLGLAIRYLAKNGACAACEDKTACEAARKAGSSELPGACGSCSGKCPVHGLYEYEQMKVAAAKKTSA